MYKFLLAALAFLVVTGCREDGGDDTTPPAPTDPQVATIRGRVSDTSGAVLPGATLRMIYGWREISTGTYDGPYHEVFASHTDIYISILEESHVQVTVSPRVGDTTAIVLVNGSMAAGMHSISLNLNSEPNGVYDLLVEISDESTDSLLNQWSLPLLRNGTVLQELSDDSPHGISNSSGTFEFRASAEDTIPIQAGEFFGDPKLVVLDHVTLVAERAGYTPVFHQVSIARRQVVEWNPALTPATGGNGVYVQDGDTLFLIPDSAIAFFAANFELNAYVLREYQMATDPNIVPTPYNGDLSEWKTEPWAERETYLYFPYTEDYQHTSDALKYWYSAKHFSQFGFGWKDTYPVNADLNDPGEGHIWSDPSDSSLEPDDSNTIGFDGESHFRDRFRAMWVPVLTP